MPIDDAVSLQAANPDRIFVGVAQFNDAEVDEDIDCAKYCLECKRRADQIRITRYPHTVAAGPATSRPCLLRCVCLARARVRVVVCSMLPLCVSCWP